MKQYYLYDKDGYYAEPAVISDGDDIPASATYTPPPQPCYKPRWDGNKWIEERPEPTQPPGVGMRWEWDSEDQGWSQAPLPEGPELLLTPHEVAQLFTILFGGR